MPRFARKRNPKERWCPFSAGVLGKQNTCPCTGSAKVNIEKVNIEFKKTNDFKIKKLIKKTKK